MKKTTSDEGLLFYTVALIAAVVLVLDIFVWRVG